MEAQNLSELSIEELLAEQKKRKTYLLVHQFIIGSMVGVAVFSVVNNGFRIFPLLPPLIFLFISVRNGKEWKASLQKAQAEVKSRNENGPAETDVADNSNYTLPYYFC